MAHYYINTASGEVHEEGCAWLNLVSEENRKYIGYFITCRPAVTKARYLMGYPNADGCSHCSPDCHDG